MSTEDERIGRLVKRRQANRQHIAGLKSELDEYASHLELLARAIRENHQSITTYGDDRPTVSASVSLNQPVAQIPMTLIEDVVKDIRLLQEAEEEQKRIISCMNELGVDLR